MSWIKVTDALPELKYNFGSYDSESVLVFASGHKIGVAIAHKYDEDCQVKWRSDDSEGWDITEYVTHWMPLPQPPKDELC